MVVTACRGVMQEVAEAMSRVANTVAAALAEELTGRGGGGASAAPWFPAGCDETTCFLRLNRYPACPFAADTFGLVPHTDSDFLTVLCQDQVGGLHLMTDSGGVAVRPRPDALVVNIGDLFQVTVRRLARSGIIVCTSFDHQGGRNRDVIRSTCLCVDALILTFDVP